VIEYFGMNKEWSGHVHWSNGGHQQSGFDHEIPDATSAFHTYAVHWRRGRTDFYLDGEYIQTIDHGDFDDSQFIMINFGIGGFDWLGDPSGNDGNMPLYYETDFVRVWQEVDDDGSTSVATPGRRSSRSPALSVEKSGSRPRLAVELDKAQSVRVELFDALGNRIIDTRNHFHLGRNTLELPRSLAGMTGFCRVSGTGFTHTRRLFITR
jgi:hypothetical protein